ncbi:MAG: DUF5630 domain-containing protein [Gammaproteobacteria bacterium]|nr:DUF5630 domain-containing protein [Gammaproteobacteria bacterium]
MKLSQFLQLTDEELKTYEAIFLMKPGSNTEPNSEPMSNHIDSYIINTDLATLIRIVVRYPEINAICESPQFAGYWQDLWSQCGLKPAETQHENKPTVHQYDPMPTVSCFTLLKGLYLYKGYQNVFAEITDWTPELRADAREYLEMAAKFGCFFAINLLCEEGLKSLTSKPDKTIAVDILRLAQRAAALYWTPGYLLLATVYQEMSLHTEDTLQLPGVQSKEALFSEALVSIYVAQKLEPFSEAMLNNAYQGKTIAEATQGTIKSWFQAKVRLETYAGGLINASTHLRADRKAVLIANKIKKTYLPQMAEKNEEKKEVNLSNA